MSISRDCKRLAEVDFPIGYLAPEKARQPEACLEALPWLEADTARQSMQMREPALPPGTES